jgi:hypothetical protein
LLLQHCCAWLVDRGWLLGTHSAGVQLGDVLLLLLVQVMAEGGLQGQAEFDTEQQLLARLSHGHLVRLLGVVHSAAQPLRCLLYELMPGGNVEEQLASEVRPAGVVLGGGGTRAGHAGRQLGHAAWQPVHVCWLH